MLSINNSEEFVNQHSILLKTTLYRFLYKYVSLDQEFSLTYMFNHLPLICYINITHPSNIFKHFQLIFKKLKNITQNLVKTKKQNW